MRGELGVEKFVERYPLSLYQPRQQPLDSSGGREPIAEGLRELVE